MNRRDMVLGLLAFGATPVVAKAQQLSRIPIIGLVLASPKIASFRVIKQGLRDAGYVEGKTIIIESRFWAGLNDRIPDLVSELIRLKPDVIVVATAPPTKVLMKATSSIPIVFAGVGGDPVALGLVRSLARPDGNVTGLTHMGNQVSGKGVQTLMESVPKLSRLAVLINPSNPNKDYFSGMEDAARKLGIKAFKIEAREPKDFEPALSAIDRDSHTALLTQPDAFLYTQGARIASLATEKRVPSMFTFYQEAEAGGLMSYGPDLVDHYLGVATYVDKILKGAKVSELPVQRSTKFELAINMKTAKALGITIPQSVLIRADRVIE